MLRQSGSELKFAMQEGLKTLLTGIGELIDQEELAGVSNEAVAAFEGQLARLGKSEYAITTVSASIAIELALEAARVGPGHEVILPALASFSALSAVVRRGAKAVIVDVDPKRLTICPAATMDAVNTNTRAVMAVHAMGIAPDVAGLRDVVDGAFILEDVSQGFPGPLLGDAAVVGFARPVNPIRLGEGAAILTSDKFLGERIRRGACLGHAGVRVDGRAVELSVGHDTFGTSARMPALSAALGMYRIANLKSTLTTLRGRFARTTARAVELGMTPLAVPRVPVAACFRSSPEAREQLSQHGYPSCPAQVYPAHLEPAALRHEQVQVRPTPRADALAVDLVSIDLLAQPE